MKSKKKWVLYFILVMEILLLTFFTHQYGVNHIDSDDSGEMALAEFLYRDGSLISDGWYYTTELRVLNTQIVMAPLFGVFDSWNMVRTVGTFLLLSIFIGSYLFMCSQLKVGGVAVWMAPVLLWPFSLTYYDFVLFGLYYIPHLSVVFASLGICVSIAEHRHGAHLLKLALLALLSCLAGMGGLRILVVCYLPFLAAACMEFIGFGESRWSRIGKDGFVCVSAAMAIGSGIGYLINTKVLTRMYTFVDWGQVAFTELDFNRLGRVIQDVILVMGYRQGRHVMSFGGIINLFILLSLVILAYFDWALFKEWISLEREDRILVLYVNLSLLATVAVCVFTNQPWAARYMVLPFILFVVLWAVYLRRFGLADKRNQAFTVCLAVTLLFSGAIEYRGWQIDSKTKDKEGVVGFLRERNYDFGFADWWGADVLTELTDGRIRMCKITNWKEFSVWYWLMEKDWERYTEGKPVFILIENDKLDFSGDIGYLNGDWTSADLTYLDKGEKVYDDGFYSIYVYDGIGQLDAAIPRP